MKRVYFLQRASGEGPIKIGCSDAPEFRRRQLGTDLKLDLALLAEAPAPGGFWDEGEIHRMFAADRVRGEWFTPTEALLTFIADVKQSGRLPFEAAEAREQVIYRRRKAGETLQAIANDYGITRERVRQIVSEIDHRLSLRQRAA